MGSFGIISRNIKKIFFLLPLNLRGFLKQHLTLLSTNRNSLFRAFFSQVVFKTAAVELLAENLSSRCCFCFHREELWKAFCRLLLLIDTRESRNFINYLQRIQACGQSTRAELLQESTETICATLCSF